MSVPIKIEKCWLKRKGNHFLEHTVPSDLFNFEHVTHVRNNVWENVNIIGDVLIQALYHHPTFTFPILIIIFALYQRENKA